MADMKKEATKPAHKDAHEEESLKGTFVAVLLLGGFLALTWLAVFALFIARN